MLGEKKLGKRAEKKKETERMILNAARTLFIEKGFDAATTRVIAEKAGVATGTIFVHFPDKRSLLAAVLYKEVENVLQEAFDRLPKGKRLQAKIIHLVESLLMNYSKQPKLFTRLLRETSFMSGVWAERFEEQVFTFIYKLSELFQEEQEAGFLRDDLNPMMAANSVWAHYQLILFLAQRAGFSDIEENITLFSALLEQNFRGFIR